MQALAFYNINNVNSPVNGAFYVTTYTHRDSGYASVCFIS